MERIEKNETILEIGEFTMSTSEVLAAVGIPLTEGKKKRKKTPNIGQKHRKRDITTMKRHPYGFVKNHAPLNEKCMEKSEGVLWVDLESTSSPVCFLNSVPEDPTGRLSTSLANVDFCEIKLRNGVCISGISATRTIEPGEELLNDYLNEVEELV